MSYNLLKTSKIFKNETRVSYFFLKTNKKPKRYKPVNVEGERRKCDLETGEIFDYKRKEFEISQEESVARSKRLLDMLLQMNDFDWFVTLTFNEKRIERTDSNAVYKAFEKFINNIKKQFAKLRYVVIPESHHDADNCIHFHLVMGGVSEKDLGLVYSNKVLCSWSKKNKICGESHFEKTKHLYKIEPTDGLKVYNVTKFIYGFSTCTRIMSRDRTYTYVKKYLDKDFKYISLYKKRFFYSSNLNIPRLVKEEIGADFELPFSLEKSEYLKRNDSYIYASDLSSELQEEYYKKYNILSVKMKNSVRECIDAGLIKTDEITPFDNSILQYDMGDI